VLVNEDSGLVSFETSGEIYALFKRKEGLQNELFNEK
jgi:hypothetical protein